MFNLWSSDLAKFLKFCTPFKRKDYINKFETLTKFIIDEEESKRFLNDVQNLRNMTKSELNKLNIKVKSDQKNSIFKKAIF